MKNISFIFSAVAILSISLIYFAIDFFWLPLIDIPEYNRKLPTKLIYATGLLDKAKINTIFYITGLNITGTNEQVLSLGGGELLRCQRVTKNTAQCNLSKP